MSYFKEKVFESPTIVELRSKVEAALKEEGFGVLTEIDIQATMKKKLDKDYPPYLILGACNPVFADQVLQLEPNIGALLPCNVTIREISTGQFEVAIMDPAAAMEAVNNPAVERFAVGVRDKLINVLENIS